MACRCGDISTLENKKENLGKVKEKSSSFQENNSCCKTEQSYLKNDSWSATESSTLRAEIADDLPEMADKVEEAHEALITEINRALGEMELKLNIMRSEDTAYHAAEKMSQQNVG